MASYELGVHSSQRFGTAEPCPDTSLLAAFFLRPLVGFLQIFPSFFKGAKCIVVRLQSLPVLPYGTLALPGDVEDLTQLDAAPDLGPPRVSVSVNGRAIRVCR